MLRNFGAVIVVGFGIAALLVVLADILGLTGGH
jgi:hypothetical protein